MAEGAQSDELTREELLEWLGVSARTLSRRVKQGLPVLRKEGRRLIFSRAEVESWNAEQGLDGSTEKPSLDKALAMTEQLERAREASDEKRPKAKPDPGRASIAKAELAGKALHAKRLQRDLEREGKLAELGLGEQIRNADTLEDLKRAALAVAAADAEGQITSARSRSLKSALSEARQVFKAYADQPKAAGRAVQLYQPQTLQIAEAFDSIVSEERRERALELVLDLLEEDLAELPSVDPIQA